jgi:hypothetical protein
MSETQWRLLACLSDVPSAAVMAEILSSEEVAVRIITEAALLGQAAPCRVFVAAAQMHRARWVLSQRALSEEELIFLATGEDLTQEEGGSTMRSPEGAPEGAADEPL